MRAYLSFLLVLLSIVLVFAMLDMNIQDASPKPLIIERAYSISMNVKENILESLRQGARDGFREYDEHHEVSKCIHCPICHPELCDPVKCMECFREHEAREHARMGAISKLAQLRTHIFDPDFTVSIGDADIEVFTQAQPLAKNGFEINSVKLKKDILITLDSGKFDVHGKARVPGGVVIE